MYVLAWFDSGIYGDPGIFPGTIPSSSNREIECNRLAKNARIDQMHINPNYSRDSL